MAWVAVDKDETEWIYEEEPRREKNNWVSPYEVVEVLKGSIEKLIGKKLTWKDEPVELKEKE